MRWPVAYVERLRAPWWLWGLAGLFVLSLGLVVLVPLGPVPALITIAASGGLAIAGLHASVATIEVAEGELRAGRAHIPLGQLGDPVVLTGARARLARGPQFEPTAYHLLRGWLPDAVVLPVLDPEDPTPYWYLSSRRPERLAAAVRAARPGDCGSDRVEAPGEAP